jgi:hypothetical protein
MNLLILQMSLRFDGITIFSNLQSGKYLSIRVPDINIRDEVSTKNIVFWKKKIQKAIPFHTYWF